MSAATTDTRPLGQEVQVMTLDHLKTLRPQKRWMLWKSELAKGC